MTKKENQTKENRQILTLANKSIPALALIDVPENASQEDYFEQLKLRLKYLLDHDMAGLLQALYRMDVDEEAVREILSVTQPDNMAAELALLVWERARKKLETRKKYR
jgi:hypothetical protein